MQPEKTCAKCSSIAQYRIDGAPVCSQHYPSERRITTDYGTGALVRAVDPSATGSEDSAKLARIVAPARGPAGDVLVSDRETVAEWHTNPQVTAETPVVQLVFQETLNNRVPGWDDGPQERLPARLTAYEEEWRVSLPRYDYPVTRIESIF